MNCGTCGFYYVEVCSFYTASNESFSFCHVYLLIYLCACEAGTRATLCVWRSKDNLWRLVSPSILRVPEIELMLPAFGFKCLFLLFHLAVPWEFLIKNICQILLNKCSTLVDKIMHLFFNIEIIPV